MSAPSVANIFSLINVDLMDNLDQVDNQQCTIYTVTMPYLKPTQFQFQFYY